MSDLKLECPHCQQRLGVPPEAMGQEIECPACHGRVQVPAPPPASPMPRMASLPTMAAPVAPPPVVPLAPAWSAPVARENWLDGQALRYSDWMYWLHLLICQCPGLVVGILFVVGCATQEGRDVGRRLLIFSGIGLGVAILLNVALMVVSAMAGGGG